MYQEYPMLILGNNYTSVLNLGQLRRFLNKTCRSLPDSTPIMLNNTVGKEPVVPCNQVLADYDSVELYNF